MAAHLYLYSLKSPLMEEDVRDFYTPPRNGAWYTAFIKRLESCPSLEICEVSEQNDELVNDFFAVCWNRVEPLTQIVKADLLRVSAPLGMSDQVAAFFAEYKPEWVFQIIW